MAQGTHAKLYSNEAFGVEKISTGNCVHREQKVVTSDQLR